MLPGQELFRTDCVQINLSLEYENFSSIEPNVCGRDLRFVRNVKPLTLGINIFY